MQTEAVEVVETGGKLPPFWDRGIVFFANLLALFFGNEEETDRLAAAVGEVDSYGGRLIPVLNILFKGADNLLVLERSPDEELCSYFRQELRLRLPSLATMKHRDYQVLGRSFRSGGGSEEVDRILSEVAARTAEWVDGYVTDETLAGVARRLGKRTISTFEGSRRGNNKYLLLEHLRECGLPLVKTETAASDEEVPRCLEALRAAGFRSAVLKAQVGASGIGMVKFPDIRGGAALPGIAPHLFYEGPVMVQGWLEPGVLGVLSTRSPSVQMFLDDQRVYLFDMTEQILSRESVHEGNESPPRYLEHEGAGGADLKAELLRQAGVAGTWLHGQGYRGTASVDFLVVERSTRDQLEVYVCEINARVTGATYPSVLARHVASSGAWLLRNLRLSEPMEGGRLLEMLDWPGHLFYPGKRFGVLPLNFNFGKDSLVHKGQFLCLADSPEECHQYLRAAESDLPVQWEVDRD